VRQAGETPTATGEDPGVDHGAGSLLAAVFAMPIVRELGLRFPNVRPGEVEVEMPYEERWSFRPGQFQATPVFAVADFAGVCAAGTLLPPGG
jgi:acyl-coenzyme A thioesterase PaaI-like protein